MAILCIIAPFAISIIVVYAFVIGKFVKGWKKNPDFATKESQPVTRVSIITACKNEIGQLPGFFRAVNEQTYRNFEFILVDDGSKDGSYEYAGEVSFGFAEMRVVRNLGFGKKSAIRTGVYLSNNELVITLDADSLPSQDWLKTIVQFYEENPSDLIICPVKLDTRNGFFNHFQQFEFASLVASGAGASGLGMPILCNGANLAFRRDAWLMSESDLQFDEPSGDDIFLLQSIKSRNGKIQFLKSTEATTVTKPAEGVKSFFNQRKRWASKLTAFKDKQLAFAAITVFLVCFAILLSLFFALIDLRFLYLFFLIFITKWIVDSLFFRTIKSFFDLKNVSANSLLFSVFYLFYILFTVVSAILGRNKNRW